MRRIGTAVLALLLLAALAYAQVAIIHSNDDMIVTVTASDEDPMDVLTFRCVWAVLDVDGVTWLDRQDTQDIPGIRNEDGSYTATDLLSRDLTQKNETWRCTAYAWDGELWSEPASAQTTIKGVGPKIDSIVIEPAP